MGDLEETHPKPCAPDSCCGGPMFINKLQVVVVVVNKNYDNKYITLIKR